MQAAILFSTIDSCPFSLILGTFIEHCTFLGSAKGFREVESWTVSESCEQ